MPNEQVVVVTGATRGLGRGIARAFGSKGSVVYITGRSATDLDAVAEEVVTQGGTAVPVVCDHREDDQVQSLFATIERDAGRLDILVNNAAAVYPEVLLAPGGFWEKPLKLVEMLDVGLRSNYVAAYYAAPIMVAARRGLIASISFYGAVSYFHGPAYGAGKAGTDKMMQDMAIELAAYNVAAISIWPGLVLTDAVRAMPPEMLPEEFRTALPTFERPEFTGLVIDALSRDPDLMSLSGHALIGAELGQRYGIADIDGKQPLVYRESMGAPPEPFRAPSAPGGR